MNVRKLVVVLGDQLDRASAAFDGFDPKRDRVWMAEVHEESTHVWSHQARIVLFLSAMRHFRDELREERRWKVEYTALTTGTLAEALTKDVARLNPAQLVMVQPGDYRVQQSLLAAVPNLQILPDRHFLSTPEDFAQHAEGRKQLRMEYFYREMRRRYDVLMEGDKPTGGDWNYDSDNRELSASKGLACCPMPKTSRAWKCSSATFSG